MWNTIRSLLVRTLEPVADPEVMRAIFAARQEMIGLTREQHATGNHTIEHVNGDTATGRCDAVVMVRLPDGQWLVGGNAYEDEYRRKGGRWRIARRRVVRPFDIGPLPTLRREEDGRDVGEAPA